MLDVETVLVLVIGYVAGLACMITFSLFRNRLPEAGGAKLREYEAVLADLKVRLDLMEVRGVPGDVASHATSQPVPIQMEARPKAVRRSLEQDRNGMNDYVLKLLADGPKTSREIESVIGRSREHTARLMKKLYELGYVSRDAAAKPYRYAITDSGKQVLKISVSA